MSKPRLLFVDTNIWLDFYRVRTDAALSLLESLDQIRDQIIMTYQVEMEFKKHRQEAILEAFNAMKAPAGIPRPGLFSNAAAVRALQRDLQNAERRVSTLKQRLGRAMENPAVNDPVYKTCQRCFHKSDSITLTRGMKVRVQIRRRAFRRFLLGYPPRKKADTSIGDAFNWEWIVECANMVPSEIHIVSRDSDYGAVFEDRAYLNDHLLQEFKERVSRKRRIALHTKLSEALKQFKVPVTPAVEAEERQMATTVEDSTKASGNWVKFTFQAAPPQEAIKALVAAGAVPGTAPWTWLLPSIRAQRPVDHVLIAMLHGATMGPGP